MAEVQSKRKISPSDAEPQAAVECGSAKCPVCNEIKEAEVLKINLLVCPDCGYHFKMTPEQRIASLVDADSFEEFSESLTSLNPVGMGGYEEKLDQARQKSGLNEGVVTGTARIEGMDAVLAVMAFQFMGGSMGSVVGEKITRALLRGADERIPVLIVSASGGARMQEGIFSLMQMAKTSHAAALLEELKVPLVVVNTHPTTGGVAASFAMLGDVIICEPRALIGFAGPRVIEGTIKQKLPDNFQTAEFQQEKGFADIVAARSELRGIIAYLFRSMSPENSIYPQP